MSGRHKTPRFQLEDDAVLGINVTPLVDVCLVLVIIFLVATPLLSQPAFDVELPTAKTKEGQEEDKVTVSISKEGKFAINAKSYDKIEDIQRDLKFAIARTDSGLVVVRADKEALHGQLTRVMALAKDSGARSITIATEQAAKPLGGT